MELVMTVKHSNKSSVVNSEHHVAYLILCHDTAFMAQHVLPHEVWLFKLH